MVRRGNSWWPQDATTVYADIQVEVCKSLLSKYEYDTVGQLLIPLQMSPTLSREKRFRIQRLRQLCQAFSLWDRFEHEAALGLLEALGSPGIAPWIRRSKVLAGKVRKTNRFQIVADLVLNAERRVVQKKYVDAVARLYRAVEMLAQTRLVDKYQIDTSKVSLEKLPDVLRAKYSEMADESGNVVLSLQQAYELLMDFNDELGLYFQGQRKKIGNALHVRNQSISGHGVAPVTEERYAECGRVFEDFIRSGLSVCRADVEWTQLPGEELVELSEETR
ncbi:MAG: TIGR02710 family CRISPR-associated protein [Candidatus Fermentithermobacillus carboniphilus]|uniref:TIGR02710 family CRISPR-associated protein n=1 Tax=Candidatus Fermentithermobacillus carboniphilus TaxID=3085328 RepID=A0AAT9LBQ3_9FIRM|nr:MAG: TIGR02710 family CRISPR-associated protein [Candidatus Fermentithermobacillus carboniphilus]